MTHDEQAVANGGISYLSGRQRTSIEEVIEQYDLDASQRTAVWHSVELHARDTSRPFHAYTSAHAACAAQSSRGIRE